VNVTLSFHIISKGLDFKPDDNCMLPLGQTARGKVRIDFITIAT